MINPDLPINPFVQPRQASGSKPGSAPVDGFVPTPEPTPRSSWHNRLAKLSVLSATASFLAQSAGLAEPLVGFLGLGVLAAPIAVGLMLCSRDGLFSGSLSDKMARLGAVSLTATAAAAIAGASVPVLTALALPAIVAAPVAVGAMIWNRFRKKRTEPQPPPPPPAWNVR
ncbi:MAG: hypothetical protein AB1758_27570 [Candidatus Eremiobacterota bacterium]